MTLRIMTKLGVVLAAVGLLSCGNPGDRKSNRGGDGQARPLDEYTIDNNGNRLRTQGGLTWGTDPGFTTTPGIQVTYLGALQDKALKTPLRIAIAPNGTLVVSDPRARSLHIFAADGAYLERISLPISPLAVAVDYLGRYLVGDGETGGVVMFDSTGKLHGSFCTDAGPFLKANDIAIEPSTGVVWIADSGNNRVVACGSEGGYLLSFGQFGTLPGEFDFPSSLALDTTAGVLYVSDSNNGRVQLFNLSGGYIRTVGRLGSGNGRLMRSQGIALDVVGRIFVADVFESMVQVFSPLGAFISWIGAAGDLPGQFVLPSDVVIDASQRLYVTSFKTGKVEIYGIENFGELPAANTVGAVAAISTPLQSFASPEHYVTLCLNLLDTDSVLAASSIRVAGLIPLESGEPVPATLASCPIGTPFEFAGTLSRAQLLGAYPDYGTYAVPVSGATRDGTRFTGSFTLTVSDEVANPTLRVVDGTGGTDGTDGTDGGGGGKGDGKGGGGGNGKGKGGKP